MLKCKYFSYQSWMMTMEMGDDDDGGEAINERGFEISSSNICINERRDSPHKGHSRNYLVFVVVVSLELIEKSLMKQLSSTCIDAISTPPPRPPSLL
jgi:hypothetical protein